MKKYLIYILILLAGLFLGYLIFDSGDDSETHEHESAETGQMWTCSMHPQVMQPEPGDCPICGMDLIPAETGAGTLGENQFSMTENAMKLANIQTSVVGKGMGTEGKLRLSGKIEVNDDLNATMPAHFDGRIEKLYVNTIGDQVGAGQVIASVYSPALVAAQQELITAAGLKDSQPQLYQAVRRKFRNWKIGNAMLDEIERTGEIRTSWPVYSHVNGTVTEIMVEEGAHIQDGMPILKVSNLSSVWAVFDAYESQITSLEEGQQMDISVKAIPGAKFNGNISFIDPILNKESRTVEVRVVLDNKNNRLKPGMFVEAVIEGRPQSSNTGLSIPATAVMWTGERSIVYVKTGGVEPVFEMREVSLGTTNGETYQVLQGLSEGEEIVTHGTFSVDAAAQLQGKSSMMNRNSKADSGMEMQLTKNFQERFKETLFSYFKLKDALVASDPGAAAKISAELLKENELLEVQGSEEMLTEHINKINEMLKAISESEELQAQREHFRILSQQMISIAGNLDKQDVTLYVQHCPMANNSKGADWISLSSEIKNPYYGEAMLNCGEVTREIK